MENEVTVYHVENEGVLSGTKEEVQTLRNLRKYIVVDKVKGSMKNDQSRKKQRNRSEVETGNNMCRGDRFIFVKNRITS